MLCQFGLSLRCPCVLFHFLSTAAQSLIACCALIVEPISKENEAWTNHGQTVESTFFSVESTFTSVQSTFKSVDNHTSRSPQRMPDRQRCPEATKFAAFSIKAGLQYQHAKNLCTPLQQAGHLAILKSDATIHLASRGTAGRMRRRDFQ